MKKTFFTTMVCMICVCLLILTSCSNHNVNNNQNETPSDNSYVNPDESLENNDTLPPEENIWTPTSDNLVGIGIYLIDSSTIPYVDGQKIDATKAGEVCTFDKFYTCYYTDIYYNEYGNSPIKYRLVKDATFTSTNVRSERGDVINSYISLQMIADNFDYNKYIVGYIYNDSEGMYMLVDTKMYDFGSFKSDENVGVVIERLESVDFGESNIEFNQKLSIIVMNNDNYEIDAYDDRLKAYDTFEFKYYDENGNVIKEENYVFNNLPNEMVWSGWSECVISGITGNDKDQLRIMTIPIANQEVHEFNILHNNVGFQVVINLDRK